MGNAWTVTILLLQKLLYHKSVCGIKPLTVRTLCVCVCVCVFVGYCLATKVFIGKLPATGGVGVIIE